MGTFKQALGITTLVGLFGTIGYYLGRKNVRRVALTGVALTTLTFGYAFREPLKEAISNLGNYKMTGQGMMHKEKIMQMDLENQIKSKELDYKHEEIMNGKIPYELILNEHSLIEKNTEKQLENLVNTIDKKVSEALNTSQQNNQQTQTINETTYLPKNNLQKNKPNALSKKSDFSNYEIDIDRSEHTFRLYKKNSNNLEELVRQGPVSLASNGGPADIYSKIYSIEQRAGDLYPEIMRFDKSKPYLVITGEGRDNAHRYEIENKMDANKTGIRILNEDYAFIKSQTKNKEIYVDIHQ